MSMRVIMTGLDPAFSAGVDLKELTGEAPSLGGGRPERTGPRA